MPANLQTTRSLTCGGPEPFGAELRDPFQGVEVDIDQPELGAEAIDPLEVVPGAPQEVPGHRHPFRGRSLELRERRAGTSPGRSRTPSRRRPPRPTAQAVPGDEDRQCVGPIGSQSGSQTPQPFVQLSEPTPTVCGLGALLLISYRTTLDAVANFGSEGRREAVVARVSAKANMELYLMLRDRAGMGELPLRQTIAS